MIYKTFIKLNLKVEIFECRPYECSNNNTY